eukprot:SAG11_NODE_4729_length_1789_cov_1.577515_4_plen_37_part_01
MRRKPTKRMLMGRDPPFDRVYRCRLLLALGLAVATRF